ncbi:MAG: hypothetical protein KAT71_07430, partial [Gammaproteobacteria bacterium]|nr:hypothetical protein [Gammaproteobacteria bacterium]
GEAEAATLTGNLDNAQLKQLGETLQTLPQAAKDLIKENPLQAGGGNANIFSAKAHANILRAAATQVSREGPLSWMSPKQSVITAKFTPFAPEPEPAPANQQKINDIFKELSEKPGEGLAEGSKKAIDLMHKSGCRESAPVAEKRQPLRP